MDEIFALDVQKKAFVPARWWEKKDPDSTLAIHELAIANDCLIDPVEGYTASYAFSSGEWDDKIYTFEGQTREEAIKLCRHPIPAMEEDRRMLYGEAWFGNAYYPFKDKYANTYIRSGRVRPGGLLYGEAWFGNAYYPFKDKYANTYMKPYQSKEEIERLLKLADTQEKDCVDHKLRTKLDAIDAQYSGTNDERFNKSVAGIKGMMEKMANMVNMEIGTWKSCSTAAIHKPKKSRITRLEKLLTAAMSRIGKLEEEVVFLKANSKLLTSDELALKNPTPAENDAKKAGILGWLFRD